MQDKAIRATSARATSARRWVVRIVLGIVLLLLAGAILLAAFPWGALKGRIEQRLSDRIGKPVMIGTMTRQNSLSFHPVVRLTDIRVPQPDWAPGRDDLARIGEARVGFSALALLTGGPVVETLSLRAARLYFYRAADGRESWSGKRSRADDSPGARPALRALTIADSRIAYRDDKRGRSVDAALAVDDQGLRLSGTGVVRGHPVTVSARAAPILDHKPDSRWPFHVDIGGQAVGFTLDGTMDGPFDIGHLRGHATAHAIDLRVLDAIIEAGLPGTQPVRLTAQVMRNKPDWTIEQLDGTIGRSDIHGSATIKKRDGRSRIDGRIRSARFDFDDLSSTEGKRKAGAKRARFGDRLVPDTAIDLASLARTDGRLELRADRLLWPGSSPFRALRTTLSLERSRLTLEPLTMSLTRGVITGRMTVDQRQGGPWLTADLSLRSARLLDFFPETRIDGRLIGRVDIRGQGRTIRQAVGTSSGIVALVARDGTIPARTAALMGQDVGKGLTVNEFKMASLRCLIVRLDVHGGIARANPVLIDTSRAQTRATGTIDLSDEGLALTIKGTPKQGSLLRLDGVIPIGGTIKAPEIRVPAAAQSAGGIIKMIGKAIAGGKTPRATDADCNALAASAMR